MKERASERMALATDQYLAAELHRILDVLDSLAHGRLVDQRTLFDAGLAAVADAQAAHGRTERLDERVVDAILHVDAIGAHAGLPHVAELGRHRAGHGCRDVRVVEHQHRRIAAQLQRDFLDRARRLCHELAANFRGSRERHLAHDGIDDQLVADCTRVASHDIEHAGGQPRAMRELGQRKC